MNVHQKNIRKLNIFQMLYHYTYIYIFFFKCNYRENCEITVAIVFVKCCYYSLPRTRWFLLNNDLATLRKLVELAVDNGAGPEQIKRTDAVSLAKSVIASTEWGVSRVASLWYSTLSNFRLVFFLCKSRSAHPLRPWFSCFS